MLAEKSNNAMRGHGAHMFEFDPVRILLTSFTFASRPNLTLIYETNLCNRKLKITKLSK